MEPKPGWKATEFWMSLVAGIGGLVAPITWMLTMADKAAELFPGSKLVGLTAVTLGGLLAMAKVFAAYTQSRGAVKLEVIRHVGLRQYESGVATGKALGQFQSLAGLVPPNGTAVAHQTGPMLDGQPARP